MIIDFSFFHSTTSETASLGCVLIIRPVLLFYNSSPETVCDGMKW